MREAEEEEAIHTKKITPKHTLHILNSYGVCFLFPETLHAHAVRFYKTQPDINTLKLKQ